MGATRGLLGVASAPQNINLAHPVQKYQNLKNHIKKIEGLCYLNNFSTPGVWPLVAPMPAAVSSWSW